MDWDELFGEEECVAVLASAITLEDVNKKNMGVSNQRRPKCTW